VQEKEITGMRTTLEANKNDVIRFCIGAMVGAWHSARSIELAARTHDAAGCTTIGFGILRLLL